MGGQSRMRCDHEEKWEPFSGNNADSFLPRERNKGFLSLYCPFSIHLWISLGAMAKEPRLCVEILPFYWPEGVNWDSSSLLKSVGRKRILKSFPPTKPCSEAVQRTWNSWLISSSLETLAQSISSTPGSCFCPSPAWDESPKKPQVLCGWKNPALG